MDEAIDVEVGDGGIYVELAVPLLRKISCWAPSRDLVFEADSDKEGLYLQKSPFSCCRLEIWVVLQDRNR